jgi:hypothetical protein
LAPSRRTRAALFALLGLAVGGSVWLAVQPVLHPPTDEPLPSVSRTTPSGSGLATSRRRARRSRARPARTSVASVAASQAPVALTPEQVEGARLFAEARAWVARGAADDQEPADLYLALDAKFDLENQHHEGKMRLWFQAPDKYRQEMTGGEATTTKILDGDRLWMVDPKGWVSNESLRGKEGARSIRQAQDDCERLADLCGFLTLRGLDDPGVTFEFQGAKSGKGAYQGEWMKVRRSASGERDITFWFAYSRDGTGTHHATWPGVVRVEGSPAKNVPTEDYILKDWQEPGADSPRAFRWPRKIEAWQVGGPQPIRFLFSVVEDLKIDAGIDPSRFAPPR